jgi:hypothetical protein
VYNLQPQYFGLVPVLHQTNAAQSLRANSYNGFEATSTARLKHRIFISGGWTREKQTDRACDMNTSPTGNALNDPNSLRFCDQTGGLNQNLGAIAGVPYRSEFKLLANVPIRWGVEVSMALYSDPVYSTNFNLNPSNLAINQVPSATATGTIAGAVMGYKMVNWPISPTTRYPADCSLCPRDAANPAIGAIVDAGLKQGTETIQLIAPGTRLTPRLNQFDLGLRKVFHLGEKYTLTGEAQFFNVLNVNTPLTESYALGSTVKPYLPGGPGGQVSVIEVPRMMRLNVQFKF